MDIINKFELLKEGKMGKHPYEPLVFSGGKIGIKQDGGKLYISVDENTSVISGLSLKETMKAFKIGYLEDITTGTVSKYKITVDGSIAYVDRDGLYTLDKVMDENTFVFSLSD
ncbi:hypothetical protein [Sporosarcina sp. Marseille-Q4943]|uniref:hypothetical protein n=1 Tax=Sporosarcina sp. Marseille-Q4943 TaxID=2942204 RepID=UPI00208DA6B2|nr:hypothetical protein [Sporosarcina sp. Marseille-Q4943]